MNRSSLAGPLTVLGAVAVLVVGALVGFRLLTASAEIEIVDACEERNVAVGEPVTPALVPVDVFNASQRAGLANRVSINLQRRGFLPGQVGNSPMEVESDGVTIVTDTPEDPRVRLLAAQFGDVEFVPPAGSDSSENIVVIVGNDTNQDLVDDATTEVEADVPVSVCLPVAPEVEVESS